MKTKILIAAGGSGGHLLPAQQLAASLVDQAEVLFAGHGLAQSPFFNRTTYPFREIPAAPLNKRIFSFFKATGSGLLQSLRLIRSEKPDVVVGFGSFHSFPLLLAALLLRKKIVLFEANCRLGKVNRLFSPFAHVAMQFSLSNKERLTPLLPWRDLQLIDQQKARAVYGLFADRTTLLVFGGSQGAQFLNQSVPGALPSNVQVLHLTGKEERVEETKKAYRERNIFAVVKSFETNMEQAYAAANGAICRSGAGTVAELIRYGVPAVLIPFPYANQHQRDNAEFLEKKVQGATMLLQEDVQLLPERVAKIISEQTRMREALLRFAKECEARIPFSNQLLEI